MDDAARAKALPLSVSDPRAVAEDALTQDGFTLQREPPELAPSSDAFFRDLEGERRRRPGGRQSKHPPIRIGDVFGGSRRVTALLPRNEYSNEVVRVRCDECGDERKAYVVNLRLASRRPGCFQCRASRGPQSPTPEAIAPAPPVVALAPAPAEPLTREQHRSRRKRKVRATTISVKRMTKRELELGRLLYPKRGGPDDPGGERPKTRGECQGGERPCPFVSCAHHLYLDVSAKTGAIKLNFPDLEVHELAESCTLDVADRGGTTLEEVGAILNLTRERVRQIEVAGLTKIAALRDMHGLRDYASEGPVGKRRLPLLAAAEPLDDVEELDEEDLLEDESEGGLPGLPYEDAPPAFDVDAFVGLEDEP